LPEKNLGKPAVKVLVIDGAKERGRDEGGDRFVIEHAIGAIPKDAYRVQLADKLDPAAALERDDLAGFGAVILLNVKELNAKQLANLESFSRAGGGVLFFLGPLVNSDYYNKHLYRAGKGLFPVPLEKSYYPPFNAPELKDSDLDDYDLLLRDDLFPARYPIFGEIFEDPSLRQCLKNLPVRRYFKAPRKDWPESTFELATLPNRRPANAYQKVVIDLFDGKLFQRDRKGDPIEKYLPELQRGRRKIEVVAQPSSSKSAVHLVAAIDDLILARSLRDFWRGPDPEVRAVLEDLVRLRQEARLGDPLIVAGRFGKGKIVAVLTSAGKQWSSFSGGSVGSVIFPPFIWETLNFLTLPEPPAKADPVLPKERTPQFLGVELALKPRLLAKVKKTDEIPAKLAKACLITPNALIDFRGRIAAGAGLAKAEWIVETHQVEFKDGKFGKVLPAMPQQTFPMEGLFATQERRAFDELIRIVMAGAKDKTFPTGVTTTHPLDREPFDVAQHLGQLKAKDSEPQPPYLVKLWLSAANVDGKLGTSRTKEPFVFLMVSEYEFQLQVLMDLDRIFEKIEAGHTKSRAAAAVLDEVIEHLSKPDPDLKRTARWILEMRDHFDEARNFTRLAGKDADQMVSDLRANRVRNNLVDKIAATLGEARFDAIPFRKIDGGLQMLATALEKEKAGAVLKRAETLRAELTQLDKAMDHTLEVGSETYVERQLIAILVEIERTLPKK
jgi:hypothetical protein